jgi:outer membrane protein
VRVNQGILAILATCILAMASLSAFAEVKMAVVDVPRAVLNSEVGKRGLAQIQAEFKAEEEGLQALQKDATALLEKLKKDTEFMSDQEFNGLLEQIQASNNEFIGRGQNLQRAVEERRQRLITALNPLVREAIEQLVLSDDYDLIIPRGVAVYSGELYDITLKLTEKLNELEK